MRNRFCRAAATRAGVVVLGLAGAVVAPLGGPARGQASGMVGVGTTTEVTTRAKVQAVDTATRTLTLIGAGGRPFTVVAGPRVINFDRIRAGDTVLAHYRESVAYVLSPAGAPPPPSGLTTNQNAAPSGALPSGSVDAKLVVTGLVVAVDPVRRTIQLVDPSGGAVTTAHVQGADAVRHLRQIKVGDSITAVVSQALAVAIEPAA